MIHRFQNHDQGFAARRKVLSVDSLGFLLLGFPAGNKHSSKIHVDYASRLERHEPISLLDI